jgi:transposase
MPAEPGVLFTDWPPAAAEPQAATAEACTAASQPRFKPIDRRQVFLRTVDIEQLIDEDHPARAIWAVVDQLDLGRFCQDVRALEGVAGRAAIDPRLLVSLWLYAYNRGIGSAREISRLCSYHPAFQWLTGAEDISGHTLSDFRVAHQQALEELFVHVLGVLSAEGFVQLGRVMQDGTKVRACAASDSFRRAGKIAEHLEQARAHLEASIQAGDAADSRATVNAQQRAAEERVERLEAALQQVQALQAESQSGQETRVSTTDPEARIMKQPDGGFAPSYNVQTSTAAVGKAIVSLDVTQQGNDFEQLTPAMDRIQRTLQERPAQMVADGGYVSQSNIVNAAARGVELIGPATTPDARKAQCYARAGVTPEFQADRFVYQAAADCFYCPRGVKLTYEGKAQTAVAVHFKYRAEARDCARCPCKPDCCPKNKTSGRSVQRTQPHREVADFQSRMAQPEIQQIYRQRSEVAETPHLWFKSKFRLRQFHVRGLLKAGLEALWAALTYNVILLIRSRRRSLASA